MLVLNKGWLTPSYMLILIRSQFVGEQTEKQTKMDKPSLLWALDIS